MPDRNFRSNVSLSPGNQIYLERPQIDILLEKAVQNPVVIACAGAGYGKTHAVYSFVRKYKILTSWIQLSERDNIRDRFWENFIAGVTLVNQKAAVRLAKIEFPETERQFERYMTIPRMETPSDMKCIFVYDDFHLIHDKAVLRFMEGSITSNFPNITSIIISRSEPPLNLVKLLSKGLLGRITEDDLRFSREEMVEYFRIQDIKPSPRAISSIYHDTEGWAFAIHLAGLSLKNASPGADYVPQAMRSNIFKLIESEIITVISGELRKFLIKLSLIDHLIPELLQKIAAGRPLIEEMEQISSFIRFDTYLNAYRIHHLLLEYLTGKQQELSGEEQREVYEQAAGWCVQNSQKLDAINYYEKAGDYARLIDVVYTLPLVMPNRTAQMLLEILNRAPPEIYDQIANAHILRTRLYLTLEMFEKAKEELSALITKVEAQPPSSSTSRSLAGCYNNLGFIGLLTSSYTRDYDYVRYFERAKQHYDQSHYETKPPVSVISLTSYLCRVNSEEKGEFERYIDAVTGAVPYLSVSMGGCALGMDDLARGELAFFKGDMSGAETMSLQALHKARQGNQYEIENRALFYLLRINLSRGNYEKIQEMLRQMEAQLDQTCYVNRFTYHDIVTGWYYSQIGQPDRLAAWLKNDFEESDLNSMAHGLEILVKAKYHLAEKRYPAALAVLESQGERNSRWAHVLGKIEISVLEAVCQYRLREKESAFAGLEHAYSLAQPNALYMPFIEMGKDMRALAGAALKDGATAVPSVWLERVCRNASAYAKKLFMEAEQRRPAAQERRQSDRAAVVLSRREKEILTGLSQGFTREEIAGFSSISVNTVKSVIRSIYNKLGAVNRADAVRIATQLGLLGSRG
ncbi:MAG: LuxR C-terminal-related transcriptional regulator [Treponema sp.]|nr:LuxR C-terminal-related transcriptional regulator [Treponema sp.]